MLEGFDWTGLNLVRSNVLHLCGGGNAEDGNGEDTLDGSVHISIEVLCFLSGNLKTTNYLVKI